jgi:hypothetical protein
MELQKTNAKYAFYLNFDAKSGDIIKVKSMKLYFETN